MGDSMSTPRAPEWLAAIPSRVSRRRFDSKAVPAERLAALASHCRDFRPYAEARVALIEAPPAGLFTGIVGGYGKISGAPHALAMIALGDTTAVEFRAGYTGEAAILEATALGLDTCWVAGFFRPRVAADAFALEPGERIVAVSPVGFAAETKRGAERMMRKMASADSRKPLSEITLGMDDGWPTWARSAVEAARLAPSAMNRQPWRFRFEDGSLVLSKDSAGEVPKVTKALDCGIAALHAELAAAAADVPGAWADEIGRASCWVRV